MRPAMVDPLWYSLFLKANVAYSGSILKCGHKCSSRCHRVSDHSNVKCQKPFEEKCPKGHDMHWKCFQGKPQVCSRCERVAKLAEKKRQEELEILTRRARAQLDHEEKLAELDAKLAREREALKDVELAEQRRNAILRKEEDVAQAAAHTRDARTNTTKPPSSTNAARPFTTPSQPLSQPTNTSLSPNTPGQQPSQSSSTPTHQPSSASNAPATPSAPKPSRSFGTVPAPFRSRPSPSKQAWENDKSLNGAANPAIDALMDMIGLEKVKEQVLAIKDVVDTASRQGVALKNRYNLALLGNPGTGTHWFGCSVVS
jgi:hypothetical protein